MAVAPHTRVEWRFSMQPSYKKILRGVLFTIIMGVPTIYAIQQGVTLNVLFIVSLFLIGALLVFGVDISKIKLGKLEIWFGEQPTEYEKTVEVEESNGGD